jgi:hypothetical protein
MLSYKIPATNIKIFQLTTIKVMDPAHISPYLSKIRCL